MSTVKGRGAKPAPGDSPKPGGPRAGTVVTGLAIRRSGVGNDVEAVIAYDPSLIGRVLESLYYGRFRRLFRGVLTRCIGRAPRILRGPLKGWQFSDGGLAELLNVYEPQVVRVLLRTLGPNQVVYDVGSNEGYFGLLGGSRVGPGGAVYAFEPHPTNAERVARHFNENRLDQCVVIRQAVSNVSGPVLLSRGDTAADPSLRSAQAEQDGIEVTATTLDEFSLSHRWPNVIKMDIEGGEVQALEGASRVLAGDDAPVWIVEVHTEHLHRRASDLFLHSGHTVYRLPSRHGAKKPYPCHILAIKLPHEVL